jgi:hypothetical protein
MQCLCIDEHSWSNPYTLAQSLSLSLSISIWSITENGPFKRALVMQPGNQYIVHMPWIGMKSDLGLLDVNFDELKHLAAGSGCRDLTMVIMKGNSVKLMRELVGSDFEVVFGRQAGSDVVFERGQGDSIYGDTSRVHSTLRVDMTLPSRPVFELRDEFALNPHSVRENDRKATRVYREDGRLRASLTPPIRTTVVESGDIMHFVPSCSHERGGHQNLEFGYSMFVWKPNFDAKIPGLEINERCPRGLSHNIYRDGVFVLQIADLCVSGESKVLFGHGEDVSACPPDWHPVVLRIGQARTRTRSKFRSHSMLTAVVDAARFTEEITVRDVFEEVDPVRLRARSTAVYTSDGVLRAQLNATQRSAKVFAGDVLVFENDSDLSYALGHQNEYD